MDIYSLASSKAGEIEVELKKLGRWMENPLPDEAFENMGAFGSNTMGFEQWLQFVLIPRIKEIVEEKSEFPAGSNLATYAISYFDGDYDADPLREILYQLDQLINNKKESPEVATQPYFSNPVSPTVLIGDTNVPAVLYSIAEVLPQFELYHLESQLQTFDTFLGFLSPTVRPTISAMLKKAADQTTQPDCKKRIEQAAQDVAAGKRAAPPYNHEEAMKQYEEEHKKNFPNLSS
jgi:uncharacterized protein YqcC (DUF446 family)